MTVGTENITLCDFCEYFHHGEPPKLPDVPELVSAFAMVEIKTRGSLFPTLNTPADSRVKKNLTFLRLRPLISGLVFIRVSFAPAGRSTRTFCFCSRRFTLPGHPESVALFALPTEIAMSILMPCSIRYSELVTCCAMRSSSP